MAAGLGFKDFTTGEVLTAADVDGYLMQGVWVFASAAARSSAVTSPQEGNYSFLKDTNSTEYYDGSGWVSAAASGGMTSLASGSLSGTSVALSTINQTYKDLQLVIKGATWGTGASAIRVQVNAITSGYNVAAALSAGGSGFVYALSSGTRWRMPTDATQDNTSDQNMYVFNLYDYTATNDTKLGSVDFAFITGGNPRVYAGAVGLIGADAAISDLTISVESGATFNGGTYILYGVK